METTTATINGRNYSVKKEAAEYPALTADLLARGFDGHIYYLTGKRGSLKMAHKSVATGKFVIVATV